MTTEETLKAGAEKGESNISFYPEPEGDVERFQATVETLKAYVRRGLLEVVHEHRENRTTNRHVDTMTVRFTTKGLDHFKQSK